MTTPQSDQPQSYAPWNGETRPVPTVPVSPGYVPPPEFPQWAPPPAPETQKKKGHKVLWTLLVSVLLLCLGGSIAAAAFSAGDDAKPKTPAVYPTVAPESSPPPAAQASPTAAAVATKAAPPKVVAPVVVVIPDGDYDVAGRTDVDALTIKPGTYVLHSPDGACYWERVKDWDQTLESIIANGNVSKSAKVTVKKSDKGLHLEGCEAQLQVKK